MWQLIGPISCMGPRANQLKMELNNHMQRLRRRSGWSSQALFSGSLVSFPDSMHRHPRVAKYTCIYDMQLLAIWRIPLLAVVLHLSLALCVGRLRRFPTSPCLSRFRNDLWKEEHCVQVFSAKLVCLLDVVALRWNHRRCSVSSVHKSCAWKENEAWKRGCRLCKLITQCCYIDHSASRAHREVERV